MNRADQPPAPRPAPTTVAGKIGETTVPAGPLDLSVFANIVAERDREPEVENKESPEAETTEAPEETEETPTQEEAGEEISEGEKTEEATDEAATEEAGEAELSQADPELTAALKGLNADAQKHLIEVATAIANGETTIGQVKRQFKLGKAENEELQRLREENEQFKTNPATAGAGNGLPATVAKLKSVAEVAQRTQELETQIDSLEDFIEKNPTGGTIGDKEFTREQLVDIKRGLRNELKVLPQRAQQLQQTAQLSQARQQMKAEVVRDFPFFAQADHPDTAVAATLLKQRPEFANFPNADYLALAMARGHNSLQAELAARKAGKGGQRPNVQTRPAGTVPAKKPAAGAAAGKPTQPAAAKPTGELVKSVKDKASFADLIAATNR